jgi:hypothetical protein
VATVVCPRCRTPHPDGARRSARCPSCHEPLGKCRYCASFDLRLLDCVSLYRPTDQHISDPDEVRDCPYFRSRLVGSSRPSRFALLRTGTVTTVLAAALFFGALTWVRHLASPAAAGPLKATVGVPETSIRDEGFDLRVVVFNPTDQPVTDVRVLISGRSLPSVTCQYVDPPECFAESTPRTVTAVVGDLPPAEHRAVRFHFSSQRFGRVSLAAHITAANTSRTISLPIENDVMP